MKILYKAGDIIGKITTAVGWVSFAFVTAMMLLNVADVLLTKLFSSPIIGSYELTQRMLMCAVFTAFAYAQTKKKHITMTILISRFPRVPRYVSFALTSLVSVAAAGTLTVAAAVQGGVALRSNYMTEVLYIPLFPFYYIESVAMGVFSLALLYDAVLAVLAIFRRDVAEVVERDWD